MTVRPRSRRIVRAAVLATSSLVRSRARAFTQALPGALAAGVIALAVTTFAPPARAQQAVNETRDPKQRQDPDFAKAYAEWTSKPEYGSPLVDHLPLVDGIPTPKQVLGYYVGAPYKLTYYADILKYYRALAKASPRVKVETIGKSDEGRELVIIYVSSEENLKNLQHYKDNQAKLADPRGHSESEIRTLIATTKPEYHLMGGLHSGETGPSEMLMELAYRIVTETSPLIEQIRNNVIVSITPAADPDGRDRNVDWFYHGLDVAKSGAAATPDTGFAARAGFPPQPAGQLPYWGKYVFHDNNRDINLSQLSMRAITDWYFTAHPPIMHDLHEAQALMYTYSGGPPQNPNLDPLLFAELPFFANWELSQMTKWGMPGVYTFAFMDGWSPGYLGSVAYNHNGMMRMYETQSGREDSNLILGDTHIFPIDSGSDVSSVGSSGAAVAGSGGFPHALATGSEPTTPIPAPAPADATNTGRGGAGATGGGGARQLLGPRTLLELRGQQVRRRGLAPPLALQATVAEGAVAAAVRGTLVLVLRVAPAARL